MYSVTDPKQSDGNKTFLKEEMKACIEQMKEYQSELKKAEKSGNIERVNQLEKEIKVANDQYINSKTEYIEIFGPSEL